MKTPQTASGAPAGAPEPLGYPPESLNVFKRGLKRFKRGPAALGAPSDAEILHRRQIAVVHIAKDRLRMTDEDYRALLWEAAGVSSSRDLDGAGFRAVMNRFEALGFVAGNPKAPQYGAREGMATAAQIGAIRAQWRSWYDGEEEARAQALRRWMERCYRVSDLRFCDVTTAQKAIEGLKAMNERRRRGMQTEAHMNELAHHDTAPEKIDQTPADVTAHEEGDTP